MHLQTQELRRLAVQFVIQATNLAHSQKESYMAAIFQNGRRGNSINRPPKNQPRATAGRSTYHGTEQPFLLSQ